MYQANEKKRAQLHSFSKAANWYITTIANLSVLPGCVHLCSSVVLTISQVKKHKASGAGFYLTSSNPK